MKAEKVESSDEPVILGGSIKSLMYGGVDGVITVSSVVASAVGASLELKVLILIGFATLIADAFSMSFSDWVSSTAERRYFLSERSKEEHEYKVHRDSEINELIAIYVNQGMKYRDASDLVGLLASKPEYKDVFLKHMMMQELNLTDPGNPNEITRDAGYTAIAVLVFGALPLFNYLFFFLIGSESQTYIHLISLAICGVSLFFSGWVVCKVSQQPYMRQSLLNVVNGLTAIIVAYLIGYSLGNIL
mmetsp:Transcript_26035/g.29802  ORF Transcript_26035/g.29802 Transcript_26035/m.29802 type:complete len:246 (-) Transcript_26035:398-1135(-)